MGNINFKDIKLKIPLSSDVVRGIVELNKFITSPVKTSSRSMFMSASVGVTSPGARPSILYVSDFNPLFESALTKIDTSSFDTGAVYEKGTSYFLKFDAKIQSRYLSDLSVQSHLKKLGGPQKAIVDLFSKQNLDYFNGDATLLKNSLLGVVSLTRAAENSLIFNKKSYGVDGDSALYNLLQQEVESSISLWSSTKVWLQAVSVLDYFFRYGYFLKDFKNLSSISLIEILKPKDLNNLFTPDQKNSALLYSSLNSDPRTDLTFTSNKIIEALFLISGIASFDGIFINDITTKNKLQDVVPLELLLSLDSKNYSSFFPSYIGSIPKDSLSVFSTSNVPNDGLSSLAYTISTDNSIVLNFESKFILGNDINVYVPGQEFYVQSLIDQIADGALPDSLKTNLSYITTKVSQFLARVKDLKSTLNLEFLDDESFEKKFLSDAIGETYRQVCGSGSTSASISMDDQDDFFGAVMGRAARSPEVLAALFKYVYASIKQDANVDTYLESFVDFLRSDLQEVENVNPEVFADKIPNTGDIGNVVSIDVLVKDVFWPSLNHEVTYGVEGINEKLLEYINLSSNGNNVYYQDDLGRILRQGDSVADKKRNFLYFSIRNDYQNLWISHADLVLFALKYGYNLPIAPGRAIDELKSKIVAPPGFKTQNPDLQYLVENNLDSFIGSEFSGEFSGFTPVAQNDLLEKIRNSPILAKVVNFSSQLDLLLSKCTTNSVTKFSGMGDIFIHLSYFLLMVQAYLGAFPTKINYKTSVLPKISNSKYANFDLFLFEPNAQASNDSFPDSARSFDSARGILDAMETDLTTIRSQFSNFSNNALGIGKKSSATLTIPEICSLVTGSISDGVKASLLVNEEQTYLLSSYVDDSIKIHTDASTFSRLDSASPGVNTRDFLCNFFMQDPYLLKNVDLSKKMVLAVGVPLGFKRFLHSKAKLNSSSNVDQLSEKQIDVVNITVARQSQIDPKNATLASYHFDLSLLPVRVDSLIRPYDGYRAVPFRDYTLNLSNDVFYEVDSTRYALAKDKNGSIKNVANEVQENHVTSFALEQYVKLMSGVDCSERFLFQGTTSKDVFSLQSSQQFFGTDGSYASEASKYSIASITDTKILKKIVSSPHLFDRVFFISFDATDLSVDELQVTISPIGQVF